MIEEAERRMTISEIAALLEKTGCPPNKCSSMASQLDRRARMDAARRGISYEAALNHLIGLMARGWSAQGLAANDRSGEGCQEKD